LHRFHAPSSAPRQVKFGAHERDLEDAEELDVIKVGESDTSKLMRTTWDRSVRDLAARSR